MSADAPCPGCYAPTADGALCGTERAGCTGQLADLLDDCAGWRRDGHGHPMPGLLAEVVTTAARLSATSAGGPRTATPGLPFSPEAAEAGALLANGLTTWARVIAGDDCPVTGDGTDAARWLREHLGDIRTHEAAGELLSDLATLAGDARRAIDRPADRAFLGICSADTDDGPCTADLYGHPDAPTARCRACGTRHDSTARREALRAALGQHLATRAELSGLLVTATGHRVPDSTIGTWIARGQLVERGGRFRIGDALDLLARARQDRRRARPHALTRGLT